MLNGLKDLLRAFRFNRITDTMHVVKSISFDGTVSLGDASTEVGDLALADGDVIIGDATGKGAAQTLSGDVTVDNAGVTTLGLTEDNIHVGDGSNEAQPQPLENYATYEAHATISNGELLALETTAIEVVAAPGANKVIEIASVLLRHNYDTAAFTVAGDSDLVLRYVDAAGVIATQSIEGTGVLDQVADTYTNGRPKADIIATVAQLVDQAVVIHNTGTSLADGGGTLDVWVRYRIVDVS